MKPAAVDCHNLLRYFSTSHVTLCHGETPFGFVHCGALWSLQNGYLYYLIGIRTFFTKRIIENLFVCFRHLAYATVYVCHWFSGLFRT